MKRRKFLKRLGLGIVVAPAMAKARSATEPQAPVQWEKVCRTGPYLKLRGIDSQGMVVEKIVRI